MVPAWKSVRTPPRVAEVQLAPSAPALGSPGTARLEPIRPPAVAAPQAFDDPVSGRRSRARPDLVRSVHRSRSTYELLNEHRSARRAESQTKGGRRWCERVTPDGCQRNDRSFGKPLSRRHAHPTTCTPTNAADPALAWDQDVHDHVVVAHERPDADPQPRRSRTSGVTQSGPAVVTRSVGQHRGPGRTAAAAHTGGPGTRRAAG